MTRAEAFGAIHDAARELGSRDMSLRICDAARAAETAAIRAELVQTRRLARALDDWERSEKKLLDRIESLEAALLANPAVRSLKSEEATP